ncbi:hypothetical protein [Sphingobacterium rhinopitheci]|uniref:hypothetical protein n=1 Tax=Sphingobacterium rhinopitheci TaxID=2781960 RepID=UPI001F516E96|nr:hypothetical protein [Sphingobacterium rhinopitheci]MCI0922327.1 hypothetical protein [Sphingobacterium rhinopitheci]
MQFYTIDKDILEKLNKSGFTILSSTNTMFDETIYWFPEKVYDIDAYFTALDLCGELNSIPSIISIVDAINNMEEKNLRGLVFN